MLHLLIHSFIWFLLLTEHTMCSPGNLTLVSIWNPNRTLPFWRQSDSLVATTTRPRGNVFAKLHIPQHTRAAMTVSTRLDRRKKNSYPRLPSVAECIADQFNYAILKGCLCYLFQSTGLSGGLFRSPEEDFTRQKRLTCLLFTFVGDVNEIVRLDLSHFSTEGHTHTKLSGS
ncbi:hypothetical protein CSKR_201410, partial [Clonorchis sinensis]